MSKSPSPEAKNQPHSEIKDQSKRSSSAAAVEKKRPASKANETADDTKKKDGKKKVEFKKDPVTLINVPSDQEVPLDIWNVYSPVCYISKKDQRRILKVQPERAQEIRKCYADLFIIDTESKSTRKGQADSVSKRRRNKDLSLSNEEITVAGYGRSNVACVALIMSLWPYFPVEKRPPMTVNVERAIEALFRGTKVCVFNESPHSPVQCLASLRLLRNFDADEGSVAIYNSTTPDVIDGYIPLAFLHSVTRGLEEVERSRLESPNGTVMCTVLPEKKKIEVECKRAFSLHCRAPQEFYVTFIALDDRDYHHWRRVLDYFVLLNASCFLHGDGE